MKVVPYDSVELGQARCFPEGRTWDRWSTDPSHVRFELNAPSVMRYTVAPGTIVFVVVPMDEDGFFKVLVEDGNLAPCPVDVLLKHTRML